MSNNRFQICIIGAGLAGSEAAYQLAKKGLDIALIEMRPQKSSPAHETDLPAELVCSNSFRGADPKNAVGLLKEEMGQLDSLVMKAAQETKVPAGGALAVDRRGFSRFVKKELKQFSNITWMTEVVIGFERVGEDIKALCESGTSLLAKRVIVATGPLTDDKLASWIGEKTGKDHLYFYDAIAPIVEGDSIDMSIAFRADRYSSLVEENGERVAGCGERGDYINCPMDKEEYLAFIQAIKDAELAQVKEFDKDLFFDGCLPIEEMVRRGDETLRYGPLKPVGFSKLYSQITMDDGRRTTDDMKRLHAVVQLRQDNLHASLYNMVGFQTRMKHGDQKRVFRMIPGLQDAKFMRLGSMHRNTYLCSPALLNEQFELKDFPGLYFSGQIVGCEGYVESAAIGLFVGMQTSCMLGNHGGMPLQLPPLNTAIGALVHHILHADPKHFQPMNVNYGLFPALKVRCRKSEKKEKRVEEARKVFGEWRKFKNEK